MKQLLFLSFISFLIISCGGDKASDQQKNISGKWTITAMEGKYELKDCDPSFVFNFTDEKNEDVAGRSGWDLNVKQTEKTCEFPGRNDNTSGYTFVEQGLFIKSLTLEEKSFSGLFTILSMEESNMVLEILDTKITFERI